MGYSKYAIWWFKSSLGLNQSLSPNPEHAKERDAILSASTQSMFITLIIMDALMVCWGNMLYWVMSWRRGLVVKALGWQSFHRQFDPYLRASMVAPLWCSLGHRSRTDGKMLRSRLFFIAQAVVQKILCLHFLETPFITQAEHFCKNASSNNNRSKLNNWFNHIRQINIQIAEQIKDLDGLFR